MKHNVRVCDCVSVWLVCLERCCAFREWRSEKVSFSESNNHKTVRLLNAGSIINEGDKTAMLIMLPTINIEAWLETSYFLLRFALSPVPRSTFLLLSRLVRSSQRRNAIISIICRWSAPIHPINKYFSSIRFDFLDIVCSRSSATVIFSITNKEAVNCIISFLYFSPLDRLSSFEFIKMKRSIFRFLNNTIMKDFIPALRSAFLGRLWITSSYAVEFQ